MPSELLCPTPAARLRALQKLDVFHHWASIDEKRYCRRCGATITGRQIHIYSGWQDTRPARLECPTPGCLAVPLEWLMFEPEAMVAAADGKSLPPLREQQRTLRLSRDGECFNLSRVFRFLRVPRGFH